VWDDSELELTSSVTDLGAYSLTAVGTRVVATLANAESWLLEPRTGDRIGGSWATLFPAVASPDGTSFVVGIKTNIVGGMLQTRDAATGDVTHEGPDVLDLSEIGVWPVAWPTDGVMIAIFPGRQPLEPAAPRVRRFVLADALASSGLGTDALFPAEATVWARGNMLLATGGGQVVVMTVGESSD
jgi:hypothetical protein